MDGVAEVPQPHNEPVRSYAPGSAERASLEIKLAEMAGADPLEFTSVIGGRRVIGSGPEFRVTMPSEHAHLLGTGRGAGQAEATQAVEAATAAAADWAATAFEDRAAVLLKAADLIAGPYRDVLNAATMLGQGKTVQQAEIDSACELIDFLRFNVAFARQIQQVQPVSSPGVWNRTDYRPLGGFVYAITPFNFTAIAGNLPTSAALMGNTVLWKPSITQQTAAHYTMEVLAKAGLPAGVINLLPGDGLAVSDVTLRDPRLAGIHFTGSTATFQSLWKTVAQNLETFHSYPRLVGETGGKDFIVAHASADPRATAVALVRGAFEYSGQKCSAASRAYIAKSVWRRIRDEVVAETEALRVGDVRDLSNFTSAVIDDRAFAKLDGAIGRAQAADDVDVIAGGKTDKSVGWYVRPTLAVSDNLDNELFHTEYFGPLLGIHVYADRDYDKILRHVDQTSRYALTGSILATDRAAVSAAAQILRGAAGNFYINDKPTGAVVGQQPFGGGRASGTNDKAGSLWNLIRWASPRTIKETLVPPTGIDYPHMG